MSTSQFNKTVVRREPKVTPSEAIARDVETFLARGGRIQIIAAGDARFPLKHIHEDEGTNPVRGIAGRRGHAGEP